MGRAVAAAAPRTATLKKLPSGLFAVRYDDTGEPNLHHRYGCAYDELLLEGWRHLSGKALLEQTEHWEKAT
jgi:hypothetical protein